MQNTEDASLDVRKIALGRHKVASRRHRYLRAFTGARVHIRIFLPCFSTIHYHPSNSSKETRLAEKKKKQQQQQCKNISGSIKWAMFEGVMVILSELTA